MWDDFADISMVNKNKVSISGIEFEEVFLSELVSKYFSAMGLENPPTLQDALAIYIRESPAGDGEKFRRDANAAVRNLVELVGNLALHEVRHSHLVLLRDFLLARGLHPTTVRKQAAILNAMLNRAFKHLDIDRLSPFRALSIKGEGLSKRHMPVITDQLLKDVFDRLTEGKLTQYKLVALLQLNTGMRLSEPVFAKRTDLVFHEKIPHILVARTELSSRKNRSSIRAIPLVGCSLLAALELYRISHEVGSPWLVPQYAYYGGNTSCSAILNKHLRPLGFRSHMFRHAFIDRLKACNDIPTKLAESITGHSSAGSEFDRYGTVGYTLEQKLEVINRVAVDFDDHRQNF